MVSLVHPQFLKPGIDADGKNGQARLEVTDYDVMNLQYPTDWNEVSFESFTSG